MKKLPFLIVIVGLLYGALELVSMAPYHIYTLTLTEGVDTKFLSMSSSKKELLDGDLISFKNPANLDGSEGLFTLFHFSNFIIPLPVNHPAYSMIPSIKIEQQQLKLGASFQDSKGRELFSFMSERVTPFTMNNGEQKIFLLPYFRNYITVKTNEEIWKDLFSKKLSLPATSGKSFFESLNVLKKISYSDLVYNLYLLYNRHLLLPKNLTHIYFNPETQMGLIDLPSEDPKEKVEEVVFVNNGLMYGIKFRTKFQSPAAMSFRAKMLLDLGFKTSNTDSSIPIYAQYKNMPYRNRVDQMGMTYLYAAWSHDLENRDFVRVIILFLERGKENYKFLQPFYDYAFKKFGTNLSSNNDVLEESANEKLKRKMKEELEAEAKKAAEEKTLKNEGQFTNSDEQINFYLQKAKEKKKNTDDKNNTLMIE